jgi:thymidylate synthase
MAEYPVQHPEQPYLDLLQEVLETGDPRIDRTGVGTRALFGAMLRFDLSDGRMPILTTKRVYWKTAIKEMLWFLTGDTNIRSLLQQNVRIWTDWPLARYRRETGVQIDQQAFEQRILGDAGFAARWGELGPVYGRQWRRWLGADGREHDQIAAVVAALRDDPTSRRILFHGWNVAEIDRMALPPCHMVYQFHVNSRSRLDCLLFQRSADLFLGAPFNFVGAAALVHMLAQQSGLAPGRLIWMGGDVHVYHTHAEPVRMQIARNPRPWPRLELARRPASIDDYRIGDFNVIGYTPHDAIGAAVAV